MPTDSWIVVVVSFRRLSLEPYEYYRLSPVVETIGLYGLNANQKWPRTPIMIFHPLSLVPRKSITALIMHN